TNTRAQTSPLKQARRWSRAHDLTGTRIAAHLANAPGDLPLRAHLAGYTRNASIDSRAARSLGHFGDFPRCPGAMTPLTRRGFPTYIASGPPHCLTPFIGSQASSPRSVHHPYPNVDGTFAPGN